MRKKDLVILIIISMSISTACGVNENQKDVFADGDSTVYEDNNVASTNLELVLDKDIIKHNFEKITETSRRIGTEGEIQICNY